MDSKKPHVTGIGAGLTALMLTATATSAPALADGVQGMLSPTTYWDQTFTKATSADCTTEGADALQSQRAWRLPGGALACTMDPSGHPWNGHVTGIYLYFDPKVDAKNSLAAITKLLPSDAQQIRSVVTKNRDWSTNQTGSCLFTMYSSDSIADAVRQADPAWKGDPHLMSAVLYSGNADTDAGGSDHVYEPTAIHLALVSLGDSNSDKDVSC